MKRPIKFRGTTFQGDVVHGYFVPQCPRSSLPGIVDCDEILRVVDPDSVAQLVGYDKHGNEVYEGDWCIDADGSEFKVVFDPVFFKKCSLKEDDHEETIPASFED